VLLLSNKAAFDEFMNFNFDCLHDARSKLSLLLLNQFSIRLDVEMVHSHLRVEARYVFIAPSKDVNILSYEGCEVLILYRRQAFAYRDGLWVCLITHINLNYLTFSQKFTLFEMLLPFKIKLLSPRISVEWLNVFILLRLTDRCHVGEELFEDYPHTTIRVPAG